MVWCFVNKATLSEALRLYTLALNYHGNKDETKIMEARQDYRALQVASPYPLHRLAIL